MAEKQRAEKIPQPPRLAFVERWLCMRQKVGTGWAVVLGLMPIVALLLLWWLITLGTAENRLISPVILPSPKEVLLSFHSLWFEKGLSLSIVASGQRVVGGFVLAVIIAFPLGMLMGSFSRIRALFDPMVVFGSYLPIPALVPLTISVFGIGEKQKIVFLALAFLVFLLPAFVAAIDEVDEVYLQTAQTMGASRWQLVRHVFFGVSKAKIFDAMRVGFGIGWTYIILAEMVAADRGLGQIIIVAQRRGPHEHIYLVLVVIVVIAWATDKVWVKAGKALFPYREC